MRRRTFLDRSRPGETEIDQKDIGHQPLYFLSEQDLRKPVPLDTSDPKLEEFSQPCGVDSVVVFMTSIAVSASATFSLAPTSLSREFHIAASPRSGKISSLQAILDDAYCRCGSRQIEVGSQDCRTFRDRLTSMSSESPSRAPFHMQQPDMRRFMG